MKSASETIQPHSSFAHLPGVSEVAGLPRRADAGSNRYRSTFLDFSRLGRPATEDTGADGPALLQIGDLKSEMPLAQLEAKPRPVLLDRLTGELWLANDGGPPEFLNGGLAQLIECLESLATYAQSRSSEGAVSLAHRIHAIEPNLGRRGPRSFWRNLVSGFLVDWDVVESDPWDNG